MKFVAKILMIFLLSTNIFAEGLNIYSVGIYDIKFDNSDDKQTSDFRYEVRLDESIFDIGPEQDNFFFLKPFFGIELTGESAFYALGGIYLEDNLGQLFSNKKNKLIFTPSFGAGYYENGDGLDLGNDLQFRTTLEISYVLENYNRLGLSFGHISNANLGNKNPGVEVIAINYQIPF